MVRTVSLALAGALCSCALAACGGEPNPPDADAKSPSMSSNSGMAGAATGVAGVAPAAGRVGAGSPTGGAGRAVADSGASGAPMTGTATSTGAGAGGGSSGAGAPAPVVRPDPGGPRTAPGFMNLAPPMDEPLDGVGTSIEPPPPDGWLWYEIEGAVCRDGSPTGFYVHTGSSDKLVIFLEGGGACSNGPFCNFNPANVNQVLAGDGQTVINTALGAIEGRQQPGVYTQADHLGAPAGIFDFANPANPLKDWSQVYVPYCTGDVHFGSKPNGSVPGLANQQFVGYLNMKRFISRLVPTFKDKVSQVLLTGSSAGGFGAAANFSMVQDSFGEVQVDVLSDSGLPFDDMFMPTCMQARWRESWGLNDSFPPDCEECRTEDGGGILKVADFLMKKHPRAHIGMISTMQDEVIRLFFSVGLQNCATYDTADPVAITVGQLADPSVLMAAEQYTGGLNDLRTKYESTGQYSSFYVLGPAPNFHQHIFRPSFYDPMNGAISQASYVAEFLTGKIEQLGP